MNTAGAGIPRVRSEASSNPWTLRPQFFQGNDETFVDVSKRDLLFRRARLEFFGVNAYKGGPMNAADLKFMAQLVRSVTDACRVPSGEEVRPGISNELAFTVVRPAGKAGYPAIWVQNFTMTLRKGNRSAPRGSA